MWWNPKHLQEAKIKAGRPDAGYFWHFRLALGEFFFLLFVTIGSLIHAVFPWVHAVSIGKQFQRLCLALYGHLVRNIPFRFIFFAAS